MKLWKNLSKVSTSKPSPSLSRISPVWRTRKKTGLFSRMSMSRLLTGRLMSRCRRWWAKQNAVLPKQRTAGRICLQTSYTVRIAEANCGITSIRSTGISTSSVVPTIRVIPEVVVKPGTTSVLMPLNRWSCGSFSGWQPFCAATRMYLRSYWLPAG